MARQRSWARESSIAWASIRPWLHAEPSGGQARARSLPFSSDSRSASIDEIPSFL